MDSYEAKRIVFSRIQSLDPENASENMVYLPIQDHGEKEMMRLAFGPEVHIHSLILKAKTHLGRLSVSNPPTPSTLLSPSPFSSNPSSKSNLSYASVVNGSSAIANGNGNEFINDYQFQDHLSFLNDSKPGELLAMHDSRNPRFGGAIRSPSRLGEDDGGSRRGLMLPPAYSVLNGAAAPCKSNQQCTPLVFHLCMGSSLGYHQFIPWNSMLNSCYSQIKQAALIPSQFHHGLFPVPSPTVLHTPNNHTITFTDDDIDPVVSKG
ncbi:hypothetical protein V6N13_136536 [Hibiscus sabdariffa]|uniref:AtC3H46-like PABC-like domain-containing protein n=1 Tax=Hibiscus sabdariffa TaxID=183260 RepID=A0ABR2DNB5_9ROSI